MVESIVRNFYDHGDYILEKHGGIKSFVTEYSLQKFPLSLNLSTKIIVLRVSDDLSQWGDQWTNPNKEIFFSG